nr:hypothetical protein [Tanacetum cinerariifolium]
MVLTLWSATKVGYKKDAEKGIKHLGERHKLCVSVKKLHGYGHLEEIAVRRADRQVYKFKECNFVDLHLNEIEDMLLLVVQYKLLQLNRSDIVDLIVALRMFTRSLIIKRRVEDLQLGVERVIYKDLNKQKRVMQADELYKFSNGTLKTVHNELHHRIFNFHLGYNKEMSRRKWTAIDKRRSELMVEIIDKQIAASSSYVQNTFGYQCTYAGGAILEKKTSRVMDPNSSLGKICLGENVVEISSGKVEGSGDWNSPEFQDTANSGQKKETKAMVFHQMDTEEVSDRFVAPCFVNGLEAYDGKINLGVAENMISNEYAVKLCLEHKVKRGNKVVKKELIVTLRGEIYFVKFIINLEKDDVEPGVILGRSFLHMNSSRNKKRAIENLNLFYQDVGTSSSGGGHLTQEEATKEALAIRISQKFALLKEVRRVIETMAYNDNYKKILNEIARKSRVLTDDVLRSLSALIYCRDLDTTTLRDLINSKGKLIPEDPQPGVPGVGIPRPPRASMQDLYDRKGWMEICQEAIEQMEYRQSYH